MNPDMYRFKSTPIQNSAWIIDMRSSDLLMLYNFGHRCDIVVIYIYIYDGSFPDHHIYAYRYIREFALLFDLSIFSLLMVSIRS